MILALGQVMRLKNKLATAGLIFSFMFFEGLARAANNCSTTFKSFSVQMPKVIARKLMTIEASWTEQEGIDGDPFQMFSTKSSLIFRAGGKLYAKALAAPNEALRAIHFFDGMENLIRNIAVIDDILFVIKTATNPDDFDPNQPQRLKAFSEQQVFYSTDDGQSFHPMDTGIFREEIKLENPVEGMPTKIVEYAQITRISKININGRQALAVNAGAGPIIYVTDDLGKTWKSLTTEQGLSTFGYAGFFAQLGSQIFVGGEHPLDTAYLRKGEMDRSGKIIKFFEVQRPEVSNRRIQFIKPSPHQPKSIFAGMEGAILTSVDGGETWNYSFKEESGGKVPRSRSLRNYPYITSMAFPDAMNPGFILAGGQPKQGLGSLLASIDGGRTWSDMSSSFIGENQFLGLSQLDNGEVYLATRKPNKNPDDAFNDEKNFNIFQILPAKPE